MSPFSLLCPLFRFRPPVGRTGSRRDMAGCRFLSASRTVSVLIDPASPSTTNSSVSTRQVRRQHPSGGSLHARWINCCSTSPLILTLAGRGGRALGSGAARKPSVTSRWRTRSTVRTLVPRASHGQWDHDGVSWTWHQRGGMGVQRVCPPLPFSYVPSRLPPSGRPNRRAASSGGPYPPGLPRRSSRTRACRAAPLPDPRACRRPARPPCGGPPAPPRPAS